MCLRFRMNLCLGLYEPHILMLPRLFSSASLKTPSFSTSELCFDFFVQRSCLHYVSVNSTLLLFFCVNTFRAAKSIFYTSKEAFDTGLPSTQMRPILEYCSHAQHAALPADPSLDRAQRKAARFINDPSLTSNLQSFTHSRVFASLSLFQHCHFGFCSPELATAAPIPATTRCSSIQTARNSQHVSTAKHRTSPLSFFFILQTA